LPRVATDITYPLGGITTPGFYRQWLRISKDIPPHSWQWLNHFDLHTHAAIMSQEKQGEGRMEEQKAMILLSRFSCRSLTVIGVDWITDLQIPECGLSYRQGVGP
jgi:hypothetical protein